MSDLVMKELSYHAHDRSSSFSVGYVCRTMIGSNFSENFGIYWPFFVVKSWWYYEKMHMGVIRFNGSDEVICLCRERRVGARSLPHDPSHDEGDGRKNVAHGCCECRRRVLQPQKVQVLVDDWPEGEKNETTCQRWSRTISGETLRLCNLWR